MNVIPLEENYASVQDLEWNENNAFLTDHQRTTYYCFDCLEDVLNEQLELEMHQPQIPPQVDGHCDREGIQIAAEKIHAPLKSKDFLFIRLPEESTLELGDGNSKKGIRLRRQKQADIERILQVVKVDDRNDKLSRYRAFCSKVRYSGLVIHPRPELPSYRHRYKKQDREWWTGDDWSERYRKKRTSGASDENGGVTRKASDTVTESDNVLTCYCREPDDGSEMVRCTASSCMFGWIHIRCSSLDSMPMATEKFLCEYCKETTAANSNPCPSPKRSRSPSIGSEGYEADHEMSDRQMLGQDSSDSSGMEDSFWGTSTDEWMDATERVPVTSGFIAVNSAATDSGD